MRKVVTALGIAALTVAALTLANRATARRPAVAVPPVPAETGPTSIASLGKGAGRGLRLPILMYHRVETVQPRWPHLTVSAASFERQMAALADAGVETLTIEDLADAVASRRTFRGGAVAVTFDDGTADQYHHAFPILRRYGIRATLYIPAGRIGARGYLSWAQLREMRAGGLISIAAHTITHRDLVRMSRAEAWEEIAGGKIMLEDRLGGVVRHLAYPFGSHDARVARLAAQAGFVSAVTNRYGLVHAPERSLGWNRIGVHERTAGRYLAALARRGGTWVALPSEPSRPVRRIARVMSPAARPAEPAPARTDAPAMPTPTPTDETLVRLPVPDVPDPSAARPGEEDAPP